ncbi:MAG: RHS repeat-associated core domain-containing protein [Bryobacteraceae bacterium]
MRLYDFRHRTYAPVLGRFAQADPLHRSRHDPGRRYRTNLYQFGESSPSFYVDPAGTTAIHGDVWFGRRILWTKTYFHVTFDTDASCDQNGNPVVTRRPQIKVLVDRGDKSKAGDWTTIPNIACDTPALHPGILVRWTGFSIEGDVSFTAIAGGFMAIGAAGGALVGAGGAGVGAAPGAAVGGAVGAVVGVVVGGLAEATDHEWELEWEMNWRVCCRCRDKRGDWRPSVSYFGPEPPHKLTTNVWHASVKATHSP